MMSFVTTLTLNSGLDPFNYLEDGSNEIKSGRPEAKGRKGMGGGRTGYGKPEVMTPCPSLLRTHKSSAEQKNEQS